MNIGKRLARLHGWLIPSESGQGWAAYLWLVYLSFFFIEWVFRPFAAWELPLMVLTVAVFLFLYFSAFRRRGRWALLHIAAIALLGVAWAGNSAGSSVFFIYAASFAYQVGPPRVSILVVAAIAALAGLTAWLAQPMLFYWLPGHRQARTRIGVMLQQSGVQENLTVRELIELFASFYPAPATLDELLDECGLVGLDTRRFDRLSGGQRQRVLYALGVVGRPDLLVLDEPTTGLDPAARRRMWSAIEARRAAGTAILLSTHFMEEAERLADRICVLDQGRVRATGTPDEIRRQVPRDTIRARTALGVEQLRALPEVQHVRRTEAGVEILSASGTQTLRALLDADPEVAGLEVRAADLETAFLALTDNTTQEAA